MVSRYIPNYNGHMSLNVTNGGQQPPSINNHQLHHMPLNVVPPPQTHSNHTPVLSNAPTNHTNYRMRKLTTTETEMNAIY